MATQGQLMDACEETFAACTCTLEAEHDGPHECSDWCGGSWTYDDTGEFVWVEMPRPNRSATPGVDWLEWMMLGDLTRWL